MNPLDVLKYGHVFVHQAIDDLPMATWETDGVCGIWSVKNIIAHLTSHELVFADVLAGILGATATPHLERFLMRNVEFNDLEVDERRGLTAEETLAEYEAAYAEVRRLAQRTPRETWTHVGVLAWYGAEYDLEDVVAYSQYGHKREHGAQVNVYKDTVK